MKIRRQAFTLVELLLVIAAIGILAVLLFPVFAQAKETHGVRQMSIPKTATLETNLAKKAKALPTETLAANFSDGTFASPIPWTFTEIKTDSRAHSSSAQITAGGNPNDFHQESVWFDSSPKSYTSRVAVLAVNNNAIWTPNGALFSRAAVAFDRRIYSGTINADGILAIQDGKYYVTGPITTASFSWVSGGTNLSQTDFWEMDPVTLAINTSSNPNFTTGNTVTFGYVSRGEHNGPGVTQGVNDIDNWYIAVFTTP